MIFTTILTIWDQDAIKGPRKKWKYLIVSDMLLYHQLDAKINWKQFQNTFFQLGLVGDKATCQKKNFQSKISNRSKQTAEKLNK